jgi:hypothetical protein
LKKQPVASNVIVADDTEIATLKITNDEKYLSCLATSTVVNNGI